LTPSLQNVGGMSTSLPYRRLRSIPRRLLRACLQSFRPPTSPFGQPSQTEYSAVLSQHIWHLRAFSVASPDGLEIAWFVAWSSHRFRWNLNTHLIVGHHRHECIRGVTVSRNRAIQINEFTY